MSPFKLSRRRNRWLKTGKFDAPSNLFEHICLPATQKWTRQCFSGNVYLCYLKLFLLLENFYNGKIMLSLYNLYLLGINYLDFVSKPVILVKLLWSLKIQCAFLLLTIFLDSTSYSSQWLWHSFISPTKHNGDSLLTIAASLIFLICISSGLLLVVNGYFYVFNDHFHIMHWFSTFLLLWPFNEVPHIWWQPFLKLFSLLLSNCDFTTVMNFNVNICIFDGLRWTKTCEMVAQPPQSVKTPRLRTTDIMNWFISVCSL